MNIVDELNMDKLFSSEKVYPAPGTSAATAVAGTHLATIATTISTAVSCVTSKAAVNHADANADETIDYKDMSADVCAQNDLKNHSISIITSSNLKPFHNDLMVKKHNTRQEWRTVEYHALGTGNTTKDDGQIYLIMNDGTQFGHLDHQSTKNNTAFITGALI